MPHSEEEEYDKKNYSCDVKQLNFKRVTFVLNSPKVKTEDEKEKG